MGPLRAGLVLVLLAVALAPAARAGAEPRICEIRSADPAMGLFEPHCLPPTPCVPGDESCAGFTDGVCGTSLADLPLFCRPRCGTVLACSEAADCRPWRDATGDCRAVSDAFSPPFRVCAYPLLGATYCGAAGTDVSPERFAACHTRPDGTPTSNYFEGNCDGDGCPNGGDALPCVLDRAPCTPLDLTVSCSTAPFDAGVPARDASLPPLDAGERPLDAGSGEPLDAGAGDRFDAPAPAAVSFGGGGGARCAVAAPGSGRHAPASIALGFALWIAARRRRLGPSAPRGRARGRTD